MKSNSSYDAQNEEALKVREVEKYEEYLKRIEKGKTQWGYSARRIAEKYGLPTEPLKKALEIGEEKNYWKYLEWIEEGKTHWGYLARRIAEKYGLPTEPLKKALEIGEKEK